MLELSRADLDVGMIAHDADAMLRFYGDVLGLPQAQKREIPGRGVIHRFLVGTNLVKVLELTTPVGKSEPTPYPWASTGLRYWTVHVVALEPLMARLAEHGVVPLSGVIDTGIGIRYIMVHDPDGNVIEFLEGDGDKPPMPIA